MFIRAVAVESAARCRAALWAACCSVWLALPGAVQAQEEPSSRVAAAVSEPLVFVCEHGSAKSVIAAALFNQMAADRGLSWRAVSRGLTPDAELQGATAQGLRSDGFDLEPFARPQALTALQAARASRVVTIGVEQLPGYLDAGRTEQWNDVPPVSKSYAQARDTMKQHIEALLDGLARPGRPQ